MDMQPKVKMMDRWTGLIDTLNRYPLSVIMLTAAVVLNCFIINMSYDNNYIRLVITFLLCALNAAVLQHLYERYYDNKGTRKILMLISVVIAIVYYLLISNKEWNEEVTIRTTVILFILAVAFLWIPVQRSEFSFNQSFMAAFKGFFTTVLLSGVLYIGIALVLGATNMLITNVDSKLYLHAANFVFVLLAPIYFLSLIPYYPGKSNAVVDPVLKEETPADDTLKEEQPAKGTDSVKLDTRRDNLLRLTAPTKFLETLVSYVAIPITAIFTVILLLYIIMNITGDFWTDNLMEPMLLSYSITVIIVYLLASSLNNAFAGYFRMIFPKVLVPVVLFQTLSSILRIGEIGITYGRYYVILFGIFATVAGILFCIVPVKKNGLIAPILIALSVISILPPVDAFTVSEVTQTNRLIRALKRNDMFDGEAITPKSDVSKKDRDIIVSSFDYLNRMEYTKNIEWLSKYQDSYNFEEIFGFSRYEGSKDDYHYVAVNRNTNSLIEVKGYDYMTRVQVSDKYDAEPIGSFDTEGKTYTLIFDIPDTDTKDLVLEEAGQELIRISLDKIYDKYKSESGELYVDTDEVTFIQEEASVTMTVIAERININMWDGNEDIYAELLLLIKIKE